MGDEVSGDAGRVGWFWQYVRDSYMTVLCMFVGYQKSVYGGD
jgi:hypothetical protein